MMAGVGLTPSTDRPRGALCQMCDTNKPSVYCKECIQGMCDSCKKEHDSLHEFDKHDTAPVCEKHGKPLTHICHACIVGICIKCIMDDHRAHGKTFDSYAEGVEMLRKKSTELKDTLSGKQSEIQDAIVGVEAKLNKTMDIKAKLKNLRALYADKISKVDNILNDIEEKYETKGKVSLQNLRESLIQCSSLRAALEVEGKHDQDVISNYAKNDSKGRELLEENATQVSEQLSDIAAEDMDGDYSSCLHEAGVSFSVDITTKELIQILHYTGEGSAKLGCPYDIKIVSPDSVIVADINLKCAFHITKDGKLISTYKPHGDGGDAIVRSAAVHGDHCFILQPYTITKVNLARPDERVYNKPAIKDMIRMTMKGSDFLIVDYNKKKIYKYRFNTNETANILQTEGNPKFISQTPESSYLVSFDDKACVKEYDEKWAFVRTMGEDQLGSAHGIAITSSGHILVADYENNRVSCFNRDGTFNKHLLTEHDFVKRPIGLAFKYPLLWVTQYDPPSVKCFEFC